MNFLDNKLSGFCDSQFWNTNYTWNSEQPKFTECFRFTALIWIPTCFLILAIINHIHIIPKARLLPIPWNAFNKARLTINSLLIVIKLIEILVELLDSFTNDYAANGISSPATIIGPMIQLLSHVILFLIYLIQRKTGIHTNAYTWIYLLSLVLCEAMRYHAILAYAPLTNLRAYQLAEYCYFPLVITIFLLESYADKPNIKYEPLLENSSDDRKLSPQISASFFSSLTYLWVQPFIWFGYKNSICDSDLWLNEEADQTSKLVPTFMNTWSNLSTEAPLGDKNSYQATDGRRYKNNHIFKVIFRLFWPRFLLAGILKLIYDVNFVIQPLILKQVIRYVSTDEPEWHGLLYASLFMTTTTVASIFLNQYFWMMQSLGLNVRSMVRGAVYRKSFSIDGKTRDEATSGEAVNLLAVDSQRFEDLLIYINYTWSAPMQLIIGIVLLYREIGWAVFAGLSATLTMMPILYLVARSIKATQAALMKIKDNRMRHINEILNGIRVIKLYAWENSFTQNIFNLRSKELTHLRKIYNLDAIQVFIWNTSPVMMAVCGLTFYVKWDKNNILDAEKAFVSLSLFQMLKFPIANLPILMNILMLALVSAKRVNNYLNSDELVHYVNRSKDEAINDSKDDDVNDVISISDACLSWTVDKSDDQTDLKTTNSPILKDINLKVKKGTLVAIVGQVGSGKSSLISGLLGSMRYISGHLYIDGRSKLAYVPQEAWILNMTLRNNILFGSDLNQENYEEVLECCSLLADLKTFPTGDRCEIGEKGINLSGGQKQRVSMARACYSDADIYLMDDPLSALDSHVAKHVFTQVISSKSGLLKDKTRLLATNSLFVLPHVDEILVMRDGRIVERGSYDELMALEMGQLAAMMQQYNINQIEETDANSGTELVLDKLISEPKAVQEEKNNQAGSKLIDSEHVEYGGVSAKVYMQYFRSISYTFLFVFIILMTIATSFNVGTSIWLAIWSKDANDPSKAKDEDLRTLRIIGYAGLVAGNSLMLIFGTLVLALGVVRASKMTHSQLLDAVIHSPMTFFDTTPLGRITNRFAKDIDVIDSTLPTNLRVFILVGLYCISSMILIGFIFPSLILLYVPITIIGVIMQWVYIKTARQIKRIEATSRAPIFSNFSETLSGMASIRAYNCGQRFIDLSDKLVDINNSSSLITYVAVRWFWIRLDIIANVIISSVALYSVLAKESMTPSTVGLVISYSSLGVRFIGLFLNFYSDLETNIVSVERVMDYSKNQFEDDWVKDERPEPEWPEQGKIDIENFSARYRPETELVLKNINVRIKAGEKIGILGRTGSGKSSLSLALFRIIEAASGRISIDGQDIAKLGLHDLRSKLTIIPQDPILFSGTLRFNLDPLQLNSDLEIWEALELAHLRNHVNGLDSGLDFVVGESGDNFSLGQRQLICLARAILRRSKILVLDEATASVDIETDSLVQKTIRDVFQHCTIITIAHRLHTVLDSDRIMVLEDGTVKELNSPRKLMEKPDSAFASLLRDAGIDQSKLLASSQQCD